MSNRCAAGYKLGPRDQPCKQCGATGNETCGEWVRRVGMLIDEIANPLTFRLAARTKCGLQIDLTAVQVAELYSLACIRETDSDAEARESDQS